MEGRSLKSIMDDRVYQHKHKNLVEYHANLGQSWISLSGIIPTSVHLDFSLWTLMPI